MLVWDEVGARYYETGVSKGIFFPIDGSTGVVWNGLVSVSLDPSGGEAEHYYYDGAKYMDQVLTEDFQATVTAVNTPREFEPCEGILDKGNGMKTHFNKRDKFHMAWRTNIGNDVDPDLGYKIHIAYNCLVQPASRSYQTIADNPTLDTRSFVITGTPACGRDSYFTFSSLEGDLSALEAQLNNGVLPKCWELRGLVSGPDTGDPDEGCKTFSEDLESYSPGEVVGVIVESTPLEHPIYGQINDGLNVIELPVTGTDLAPNDTDATLVGTDADPLSDEGDDTYVTSSGGDLGWTVPIPRARGRQLGAQVELHIRMSITGGVSADDPDNIDADAQVFIVSDDEGEFPLGGFSDGTDAGMGFALSDVDGNPVDYVVPMYMDPWVNTTYSDVLLQLFRGGMRLMLVGATNNNPEDPDADVEVRVYEASLVILNSTDEDRYIRYFPGIGPSVDSYIQQDIYTATYVPAGINTNENAPYRTSLDFKVMEMMPVVGCDGFVQSVVNFYDGEQAVEPGVLKVEMNDDLVPVPIMRWYDGTSDEGGTLITEVVMEVDEWYTAVAEVSDTQISMKVFKRTTPDVLVVDDTRTVSITATTAVKNNGGVVVSGDEFYEVGLDNAFMVMHCNA